MIVERHASTVEIQTPAKVNLYLDVQGKRKDGFHEIETVLCPISLFDRLRVERCTTPEIKFSLLLPDNAGDPSDPAWLIPEDDANLVVRAARRVQACLGTSQGCSLQLEKTVPAGAGLGGGSSNAAAAVTACLLTWSSWDRRLATTVCAELGSDVPFFLGNRQQIGMAHATGRGELCRPLLASPPLDFILTHPPVGCSTQQVYENFQRQGGSPPCAEIIAACESRQAQQIGAALFNALQFSASSQTNWIQRQLDLFSGCGLSHALMSGSGSSCFAVIDGSIARSELSKCVRRQALAVGITRVYEPTAWYGPAIEDQV